MDFSRNPVGPVEGCADRFHVQLFVEKFRAHVFALQHIFSTGKNLVETEHTIWEIVIQE